MMKKLSFIFAILLPMSWAEAVKPTTNPTGLTIHMVVTPELSAATNQGLPADIDAHIVRAAETIDGVFTEVSLRTTLKWANAFDREKVFVFFDDAPQLITKNKKALEAAQTALAYVPVSVDKRVPKIIVVFMPRVIEFHRRAEKMGSELSLGEILGTIIAHELVHIALGDTRCNHSGNPEDLMAERFDPKRELRRVGNRELSALRRLANE